MIMTGNNIVSVDEPLRKIQTDNLVSMLRNPSSEFDARIRQLRIIYNLDAKQYSMLKKSLPYVVCGIFSPPYRRKENFAYIENFIVDIDKLAEKNVSISELKSRLAEDDNVMLCFTSPSEDGLKVMFRLEERCYDANLYSIFYKEFLKMFSARHNIGQVVDTCTCDVSRACFLSVDRNLIYRPNATAVKMAAFVPEDNPLAIYDIIREQNNDAKQASENNAISCDPDDNIMDKIKQRLNIGRQTKKAEHPVFVPEEIQYIMSGLKEYIEETGIQITEEISIQYGKKLKLKAGMKLAEINIFYGKRGFSVVKTPRCGTDESLNEMASLLIRTYIDSL